LGRRTLRLPLQQGGGSEKIADLVGDGSHASHIVGTLRGGTEARLDFREHGLELVQGASLHGREVMHVDGVEGIRRRGGQDSG